MQRIISSGFLAGACLVVIFQYIPLNVTRVFASIQPSLKCKSSNGLFQKMLDVVAVYQLFIPLSPISISDYSG